jgi:hypothetical protein
MKTDKSLLLVLFTFLVLSVLVSWQSIIEGGHFVYRDATSLTDLEVFRADFFSIYKSYNAIDFDFYKRIPESWIYLFIDMETYDRIKFTLIPFAVLTISFFVGQKILEEEGLKGNKARLIAAASAFVYLFNPITLQVFLKYYPMLNLALFPLFFYLLYTSLAKLSLRNAFLAALVAAFMFLMVIHTLLYLLITVPIAILVSLKKQNALRIVPVLAVFGLTFIFATAFVTIPYVSMLTLKTYQGFHSLSVGMLGIFSFPASLPSVLLLDYQAFWWPWVDYEYPFEKAFFLVSFAIVSVMLVFGLRDRNHWSVMALLGLVAAFFFSKGSNAPFGFVYGFLNFNLPLIGWLMRVPNKFLHIIPFFLSILFLRFCFAAYQSNGKLLPGFALFSMLFLSLLSWPYFTGDAGGNLQKTEYTAVKSDLYQINQITNGTASLITHYMHKSGSRDLYANSLDSRPFFFRELLTYAKHSNFSGISTAGNFGVEYLLVGGAENGQAASESFEEVYSGDAYTLLRISNKSSHVTSPSQTYANYGSYETLRSMMRYPPEGTSLDLVLLPAEFPDHPEDALNAVDTIILDSTPVLLPSLHSENMFSFYPHADAPGVRRGWTRLLQDASERAGTSPFSTWDSDFDKGFASTQANTQRTGKIGYVNITGTEDLMFTAVDRFSEVQGTSVQLGPGNGVHSSVRSLLDLSPSPDYRINLTISGNASDHLDGWIFIHDVEGNTIRQFSVFENSTAVSRDFTMPSEGARAYLLFTAATSEEPMQYSVEKFVLEKVYQDRTGPKITSGFYAADSADYDIYLRVFKSPSSGRVRLYLDGEELYTLETNNDISHLYWEKAYSGYLSQGTHNITVEQLSGYNALNVGYLLPENTTMPEWKDKSIIFRLTAFDFGNSHYRLTEDSSASTFYLANSSEPLHTSITVFSDGEYHLFSSIKGEHKIVVDSQEAVSPVYLEKGVHTIDVIQLNGTIQLDHVTLIKSGQRLDQPSDFSYVMTSPSSYRITANSTGPFFISLARSSDPVWAAKVNGKEYRPFPSYHSAGAFLINESGPLEIMIECKPQNWSTIGAVMTLAGLLGMGLVSWRYGK